MSSQTMARSGAEIYYEIRGAGPVLLLISVGNGDTVPYQSLANALADDFTVLTYDRRGFWRTVVTDPVDDSQRVTAATSGAANA